MFQVKYYKDYQHNYLIIKCEEENKASGYQRKMITTNVIKGLLPCQERHVNGDTLLYYEITSKQNLAGIYASKSINLEFLQHFFLQLKLIYDVLQKYLLDERSLLLYPEYIYQDMESGEFFFLYYPEEENTSLNSLMDFFVEKVCEEDAEAVETVYKIADLIHKQQFVLDEVLEWFQDSADEKREDAVFERNMWEYRQGYIASEESKNEPDAEEEKGERGKIKKWLLFPSILSIVMAGILLYIMYAYKLSEIGKLLLVAGWCIVTCLLGIVVFECLVRKADEEERGDLEQRIKETPEEMPGYTRGIPKEKNVECGNTVYIPWIDNCENCLYGEGKGNKHHIDLNRLPLTVGKMAGAVDMVINETSISRMHAKFSKGGNKVYVTDLNSTNGTFKNGLRLEPNASEIIEPGDEIRLGKLKFIYR